MSAKTVTGEEGTGREAVLRAMQEAAECVSGKNGVPKGYKGTKGIVILSNDTSYTDPEDAKKKKKEDDDEDDDEGSETSSIRPRNLSYSSQSERGPKSPAKRKKKARWPPRGEDDEEEEGEIHEEDEYDDDDDDSGSNHSYGGLGIALDHVKLYEWLLKWTKEHGLPAVTPMGVFNTLCLDGTMDEWLTNIDEVNVPNAWADDGWYGMSPGELVCVFTYLTILLTLGDLTVESGVLTASQGEMFWAYRQALILYAADPLVHKIVVELSRMVRVCLVQLTPKKKEREGGAKASRMTYSKDEPLIAISQNAGKKQVAARLRSYRDCTGEDSETQLTEQSLLNAIKAHRVDRNEAKHMDNLSDSFTKYMEVFRKTPKSDKRSKRSLHQCCLDWLDEVIPMYDENPDWSSSLNEFETLYQQGSDPINFLSQVKQSHMQMELTYQEAGKPLQKAYDSEEGLIVFTLARMDEGIMEKLIERRLQTTGSDEWDTWAEFTKDVKQVHDIIQAVKQNLSKRSKDRKSQGKEDEKKEESKRDRSRSARTTGTQGGGGGGSSRDGSDHRPLVKNHFKNKVWHKAPYDRCTMPPYCADGSTICVYLWWGLTCKFCAEGNCQAKGGKSREKRPRSSKPCVKKMTRIKSGSSIKRSAAVKPRAPRIERPRNRKKRKKSQTSRTPRCSHASTRWRTR